MTAAARWTAMIGVLSASCQSKANAPTPSSATRHDSAGIAIVENRYPRWKSSEEWSIDSVPTIVVGDSASGWEISGEILEARILSRGGVAVTEVGPETTMGIVVYDKGGRFRNTIGRKGGGPGEFEVHPRFVEAGRDTIMAWDYRLARMTWVTVDGTVLTTRSMSPPNAPAGVQIRGYPYGLRSDGALLVGTLTVPTGIGLLDLLVRPLLVRDTGRSAISFGVIPVVAMSSKGVDGDGINDPYRPIRRFLLGPDPYPVSLPGRGRWEIIQYGIDGRIARSIRATIARPAVPVPMARRHGKWFPVPDSLAAIMGLWTDGAGHIWAGRTTTFPDMDDIGQRPPTSYDIIDSSGEWLGTVRIPEGLGRVLDISNGYLLFHRSDQNDLQTLSLHRIIRP